MDNMNPSSQNAKKAIHAFSDMTNTMSDCSSKNRPMSERGLLSETTTLKDITLVDSPPDRSLSVDVQLSESYSDSTESHSRSEETQSIEFPDVLVDEEKADFGFFDEDPDYRPKKKPRKPRGPPPKPTAIYFDEKDKFQVNDPNTGAVTFWLNTAPLNRNPRLFFPRWLPIVPDPGTPPIWPPPEIPSAANLPESLTPEQLVSMFAETAMENQPIRKVDETRFWPDLAFARIHDLDRALADAALRLSIQAIANDKMELFNPVVAEEEKRMLKTNILMEQAGEVGEDIGKHFESAANQFEEISCIVEQVLSLGNKPSVSAAAQQDLSYMKNEMYSAATDLKWHLLAVKGQIMDYTDAISGHGKEMICEGPVKPPIRSDDEIMILSHRAVEKFVAGLKDEIKSEFTNDKTGIMQRWFKQSRLRQVLDNLEKSATDNLKLDDEYEKRRKIMSTGLSEFYHKEIEKRKVKPNNVKLSETGTFGPTSYFQHGGKRMEMVGVSSDCDLYTVFEPGTFRENLNPRTNAQANRMDYKKNEGKETKGNDDDFYAAPEQPYDP